MPTQLSLYNRALVQVLGERKLASLTEDRKPRHLLDVVWDDNAREYCLEQGLWNFAMRTVEASYDSSVTPSFGYQFAFSRPTDFIRTAAVCTDEYYREPLLRYADEQGYWYSDLQVIYIKYVSKDNSYGFDLSLWPESFTNYVAHYLACRIAAGLTKDANEVAALQKGCDLALTDAKSKDAMADPTKFPPQGSWVRSRRGRGSGFDRGNRTTLIG